MNEDDKKAMKAAWQQWHADIDPELVPIVNPSFEVGFEEGMAHARVVSDAAVAGLRGENAVLADILRDADEILRVIEADDSDESDSLRELRMAISYALAPYDANGDLLK